MSDVPVWLDLNQAELDAAYDQLKYAPNQAQILKRYASNSDALRLRFGAPQRLVYGAAAVEGADLYRANKALAGGAPINIFIHGGAWRSGFAKDYGFLAELFVNAGAHFVVPDFSWVQDTYTDTDTGASLEPMVDQLRRAVVWVHQHAASFGGDPEQIYISGHSSGGHLAAVLLATDWKAQCGLPADLLKGGLCCSGIYELKPVALSARNVYLKLTAAMEEALSPQRQSANIRAPLLVVYGSLETPEFQRQALDFASALKESGKEVALTRADAYNHFEILETLASPYGVLGRAVLMQMKLTID